MENIEADRNYQIDSEQSVKPLKKVGAFLRAVREEKGLSVEEGQSLFEKFHTLVTTGNSAEGLGKLEVLGGVHKYPSRVKCASLAWHTFNGAVNKIEDTIRTE